jgi:hypothetical protein
VPVCLEDVTDHWWVGMRRTRSGAGQNDFPIRVKSGCSPMARGWLAPSDWLMQLVK